MSTTTQTKSEVMPTGDPARTGPANRHTPLRWHFVQSQGLYSRHIYGQRERLICSLLRVEEASPANAEFIVRACHWHYELVGLMKTAAELLGAVGGEQPISKSRIVKFLLMAERAVLKAETRTQLRRLWAAATDKSRTPLAPRGANGYRGKDRERMP